MHAAARSRQALSISPLELPREENLGVIGGILLMIRCCVFSSVEIVRATGGSAANQSQEARSLRCEIKIPVFPKLGK
jgi:hypothetical protein